MLSNDTRKIIDDARDTLVGQIPVPMMQCQQITLALTYKFMSDDDQTAVDLGGRRHYFTGDLERYGWDKIMSLRLDDTQRSELYRTGLSALQESETMPAVFREIFRDAVVPYGDHRTLALFLSTMNRMVYDDSEKLGDAYEYLLKTAEAQADAGQFRTPRHIIDFIVKIINPQKHEVIIDPACGTAGFLVSSYQHVKSQHEMPGGGSSLSVPDFTRLSDNLKGYDISPEMTKLAMANMYLHTQDKDPNIDNYDTLTSTDHWNDYADVMLANPPFMTPKGGIRPHSRFRVPAKRAEVLFVDYIASHLNEHGRAGIIVPEGIVFQSQNAYRQLRRFLLDESLVAVISLPGGVFNPYSGVKTSILILDKVLASMTAYVGFFKVENDGYDLGAQRRPIDKDDLPAVSDEINDYLRRLRAGESVEDFAPLTGMLVTKERIAEDPDRDLSAERYKAHEQNVLTYPVVAIGEVVETITPPRKILKSEFAETGRFPIIDQSQNEISGWTDDESAVIHPEKPLVIFGDHTCSVKCIDVPFAQGADGIKILKPYDDLNPLYLFHTLRARPLEQGGYKRHFSKLKELEIPLPPLEVQRELVAEIEGYQRVIDGARAVVDNWWPRVTVDPEWPLVAFSEAPFAIIDGDRGSNYPKKEDFSSDGYCVFLNTKNVRPDGLDLSELQFITKEKDENLRKGRLCRGDVVLTTRGTIGNTGHYDGSVVYDAVRINSGMLIFRPDENNLSGNYLFEFFQSQGFKDQIGVIMSGSAQPQLPIRSLNAAKIPLPSLDVQHAIVAEIEAERQLVSANRELVGRMERHIQDAIARVWEG